MNRVDYIGFQDRIQPLAYLITFRCYGTWFHGENRGSVDRKNYHIYGTPDMPANQKPPTEHLGWGGTVREGSEDSLAAATYLKLNSINFAPGTGLG